ncbi:hypothetical protein [Dyadobacter sp. CY323]|uniref:hypothetical protein n=1 Tax=Dyadobacter sp. CY323 TaxID=2907302 RepID=UPI001F450175|nr:hypothetical protein [Dyadobacter sp. CY323]MCE6992117.1 hypothetical protein [Dyadobacter sp. CY323]
MPAPVKEPQKTPRSKKTTEIGFPQIALACAGIIKEIGLPGFIVTFVCTIFFLNGSSIQKQEFIDKYILFKGVSENPFPFGMVVIALIICSVVQHIYYSLRLKVAKGENERMVVQNNDLQKRLLARESKAAKK